jgi:hypothetical protein
MLSISLILAASRRTYINGNLWKSHSIKCTVSARCWSMTAKIWLTSVRCGYHIRCCDGQTALEHWLCSHAATLCSSLDSFRIQYDETGSKDTWEEKRGIHSSSERSTVSDWSINGWGWLRESIRASHYRYTLSGRYRVLMKWQSASITYLVTSWRLCRKSCTCTYRVDHKSHTDRETLDAQLFASITGSNKWILPVQMWTGCLRCRYWSWSRVICIRDCYRTQSNLQLRGSDADCVIEDHPHILGLSACNSKFSGKSVKSRDFNVFSTWIETKYDINKHFQSLLIIIVCR